jgi:hypothetical protein
LWPFRAFVIEKELVVSDSDSWFEDSYWRSTVKLLNEFRTPEGFEKFVWVILPSQSSVKKDNSFD